MIKNKSFPLQIGIIGTGYAAKKRAEAIKSDSRAKLIAVTGNNQPRLREFCATHSAEAVDSWARLVNSSDLDLIFICTVNQGCGAIAKAAILAGKHVVVEYPLALEASIAAEVIELAATKQKLLHVEHIEIIGGLHQAVKQYLPQIGRVFHASYSTITPQHSVARSWKYHQAMFGFPLAAALSRIHRLTDLFGAVNNLTCNNRYWNVTDSKYFTACFCNANLNFKSGITASITYGKGNIFYDSDRTWEIYGEQGKIVFDGQQGTLMLKDHQQEIPIASRRGLFALDTSMVLDYLWEQKPLYIQPQASLYALQVANAAEESSLTGQIVYLN